MEPCVSIQSVGPPLTYGLDRDHILWLLIVQLNRLQQVGRHGLDIRLVDVVHVEREGFLLHAAITSNDFLFHRSGGTERNEWNVSDEGSKQRSLEFDAFLHTMHDGW